MFSLIITIVMNDNDDYDDNGEKMIKTRRRIYVDEFSL